VISGLQSSTIRRERTTHIRPGPAYSKAGSVELEGAVRDVGGSVIQHRAALSSAQRKSDYITYLEVVGGTDWIDAKMVLEFDGVRYEFVIEVKTSRISHRNSAQVRKQFKKETDIARDDSGEPVVYGGAVAYDALNLTLCDVDYYRLQRKEGAILGNLIVLDDSMQLRLCNKMTPRQMQNARSENSRRKPFQIHDKKAKHTVHLSVCVSGGLGDMLRMLAMNGSCGLLNIA
jgi:hypothetical protein